MCIEFKEPSKDAVVTLKALRSQAFPQQFPDGAVLDEAQRPPELLSWIQGLVDDSGTCDTWGLSPMSMTATWRSFENPCQWSKSEIRNEQQRHKSTDLCVCLVHRAFCRY